MRCAKGKGVMKNDDVGDRRGRCVFFLVFLAGADSRQQMSLQMSLLYVVYLVLYCTVPCGGALLEWVPVPLCNYQGST